MLKVWNRRDPKTPKDAVYVGRPGKWGNPFPLPANATARQRDQCLSMYLGWITQQTQLQADAKVELKGHDLICWCAPKPCHADILLEIANS